MGVVQVSLEQVISGLGQSFHSIDSRVAASRSLPSWRPALTGLRISSRPVEEVTRRHAELDKSLGKRETESFRIFLQAFPFKELEQILRELAEASLTVEGEQITFSGGRRFESLKGSIKRDHELVRPWKEEGWPALYYSAGARSTVYNEPEMTAEIRRSLGLTSVQELVDAFLEVRESSDHAFDFFIHVEMPARIKAVEAVGQTLSVQVAAEQNLRNLNLFLSRKDFRGITLLEHQKLALEQVECEGRFAFFQAKARLASVSESDVISCVLTHERVPELDEETGGLRKFMPPLRGILYSNA